MKTLTKLKISVVVTLITTSFNAFAEATPKTTDCFVGTAALDIISTDVAINNGAIEANPVGEYGVILVKAGVYSLKKKIGGDTERVIDKVACPLMSGASFNNFALAANMPFAPQIGLVAGVLYYFGARLDNPLNLNKDYHTYDANSN